MRCLILALLAACGVPDTPETAVDSAATLPTDHSGPHFRTWDNYGFMHAGAPMSIRVFDIPPNSLVNVYLSLRGPGPGPCPAPNLCLDIVNPLRIAFGRADSTGEFLATFDVPIQGDGRLVSLQALAVDGARNGKSGVTLRLIGDTDFDLVLDTHDVCPDVSDPAQIDGDEDGAGAACDCDDGNSLRSPGRDDESFDNIDQDCDDLDAGQPLCPAAEPFRCADGSCTSTGDLCPTTCPRITPVMCPDGTCVRSVGECAYSCPAGSPVICPDGSCADSSARCPVTCDPASTPFQCPDGTCRATPSECLNSCPVETPVRCPDGVCTADLEVCGGQTCPSSAPIICPSGDCATTLYDCPDACSPTAPLRCPDGACALDTAICSITCDPALVRCPDGRCVESSNDCVSP